MTETPSPYDLCVSGTLKSCSLTLTVPYFVTGGSFMNIMGVNLARYHACPDIKKTGLYGQKRLKIYISAEVI